MPMRTPEQEQARNEALWEYYDFDQYGGRFFGFTFNLQQIATLSMKPAIRVQVGPAGCYKGCLVRMPNGDLIATPMNPDIEGGRKSLVYRSTDQGLTWEQIAAPPDLPGKEHGLAVLSDGTLLHIGYGGWVSRSEDAGWTWETRYTQLPFSPFTRNIEERPDGSLLVVGVTGTAERFILCTSQDGGRTWEGKEVPVDTDYPTFTDWDGARVNAEEPSWLTLPDGKILLAFRGEQTRIIDDYTPPFLYDKYTEVGDHMLLTESTDGGETWSTPRSFTNYGEPHGYLTLLEDGRLLCTYANYHLPYGICAIFSDDLGNTWDTEHPILLALSSDIYVGWPVTLQLPDGSMITSYATTAFLQEDKDQRTAFQVVHWELPPK